MSKHNSKGREINGVVLLDKAIGLSSNVALQQVKHLFNANKAGHTGSLDPLASGILPICLGQATKIAQFLLGANKRYVAVGQLGSQTTTADSEGKVVKSQDYQHITETDIKRVLPTFLGDNLQTPPMYSALKKDGKPLYQLARQGIEVERKQRPINIDELTLLSFDEGAFEIEVLCSKGTYIRTLVEDIAASLGNVAFVSRLRRTGFAHYDVTQALSFDRLCQTKDRDKYLRSTASVLKDYKSIKLDKIQAKDIQYGRIITYNSTDFDEQLLVKLFTPDNQFLGLGRYNNGNIYPKRLLITQD